MDAGKLFITLGIVLTLIGLLMTFGPSIPLVGKLPGDIYIKKDGFTFYFPITTSILVSLILTLLFRIFSR